MLWEEKEANNHTHIHINAIDYGEEVTREINAEKKKIKIKQQLKSIYNQSTETISVKERQNKKYGKNNNNNSNSNKKQREKENRLKAREASSSERKALSTLDDNNNDNDKDNHYLVSFIAIYVNDYLLLFLPPANKSIR